LEEIQLYYRFVLLLKARLNKDSHLLAI